MLYFSSFVGKKCLSSDHRLIGVVTDCVFLTSNPPRVTKFEIKTEANQKYFINTSDIGILNSDIILSKGWKKVLKLDTDELMLKSTILDKQIIDIEGKKVVRVNDISFSQKGSSKIFLAGVDTSFWAVWRWVYMEKFFLKIFQLIGKNFEPQILTWSQIQLLDFAEGKIKLNTLKDNVSNMPAEDLADYLEKTTIKNVIATLDLVDPEYKSEVIAELNLTYQMAVFEEMTNPESAKVIEYMESDEAVDVLLELSKYRRNKILARLGQTRRSELLELIALSKHGLGKYLSTEFLALPATDSLGQILAKIRTQTNHFGHLYHVYLTSKSGKLVGVMSLHDILTQKSDQIASDCMETNLVISYLNTPLEVIHKRMIKYNLSALPVLDKHKEILGIVTFDDVHLAMNSR